MFAVSCIDTNGECFVFIGDSLVANWDIEYYFPMICSENYGKDSVGVNDYLQTKVAVEGKTVILLVGTNDLTSIKEFTKEELKVFV